jgi:peptidoglycan/LPS O-acetylase OafA/YrhL
MSVLPKLGLGSEKYRALTGIRAVGACVVFFDHVPLLPDAHVVINVMAFFFVLSGFLIARIYYQQVQLQREWLTKYFVNRFARIYPVYFLLLTIMVVLHYPVRPVYLLTNYTLTHALFHGGSMLIQASWSLTVEETFYFLAPVFMLLTRRWSFLAPFAVGWLLLAGAFFVSTLGFSFLGTPLFMFSATFFGNFLEFFAGFYLALVVMRAEERGTLFVRGWRSTGAGLLGVVLLSAAMVLVYRRTPLNFTAIILINNFLIPFPIALLYWGLIRETTWLSRLLSTKFAGLLGRSSYCFYLLQGTVVAYLPISVPASAGPVAALLFFGLLWGSAILLFVAYEEPLNVRIRNRFRSQDRSVGMSATLYRA